MAQGSQSDSSFYQSAVYNTIDLYRQFASDQSRLYNGRRYKPYDIPFVVGVPFFQSDWFTEGTIIYEDGYYDKVMLLYDEVKEPEPKLGYRYNFDHLQLLNDQLLKGGVRLAGLLNEIFK